LISRSELQLRLQEKSVIHQVSILKVTYSFRVLIRLTALCHSTAIYNESNDFPS